MIEELVDKRMSQIYLELFAVQKMMRDTAGLPSNKVAKYCSTASDSR